MSVQYTVTVNPLISLCERPDTSAAGWSKPAAAVAAASAVSQQKLMDPVDAVL